MPSSETAEAAKKAFDNFKRDKFARLRIEVRRERVKQLRKLLADHERIDVDLF